MSLALLALLADGDYHSGQALGQQLGVSRTAIWKQIDSLIQAGATIETQRGKGYCWCEASPLLNVEQLQQALDQSCCADANPYPIVCDVLPSTASTNQVLLQLLEQEIPAGISVVAEQQSQGRGRRGRTWQSPVAQNIYLSTLVRATQGAVELQGLSLVVGISVVDVLKRDLGVNASLKWPNDIWLEGRKLGGILVEVHGDINGDCAAVIGLGLNCNMQQAGAEVDQAWISLAQHLGRNVCRNQLVASCLQAIHVDVKRLKQSGFEQFLPRWAEYDALTGLDINIDHAGHIKTGHYLGINHHGALIVEHGQQRETYHGGEVSVRPS